MIGNIVKVVVGIGAVVQLLIGGVIAFNGLATSTGAIQGGFFVMLLGGGVMFLGIFTLVGLSQLHERKKR